MPTDSESCVPTASMTPRVFCKKCGYALVGLASSVCPECGRGFDLGNRRTFARRRPRGWVWRWGRRVLAVVLLLMLAAGAGVGWLWWGWRGEQGTIARLRTRHYLVNSSSIGPERLRLVLGERLGYLTDRVDRAGVWTFPAVETEQFDFASLSHIQQLRLTNCELNNSNLSKMAGLGKLRELRLSDLRIERPDLAFLEKLPNLTTLELSGEWVAKGGFEHLAGLKHLKYLDLHAAGMNDGDLQQLHGLSSLERLELWDNPISDAGLGHLHGLKSLRVLWIDERLLGSSGVAKLKQSIPHLEVEAPHL